jgi:secondary thiamine-phosphate synthase enzyme
MRQAQYRLAVETKGRGFYEITDQADRLLRQSGLRTGLATLHLRHTSASLLVQENADPEVRRDLERFFQKLCPDGDPIFAHTSEGPDDMPAHVRSALTATNLSIPFEDGAFALGVWQGIFVWEHRHAARRRELAVHFIGE